MRNLFRYIGWRRLKLHPGRTVLTTLGVALGISLYIAISIINRSTLASFKESIESVAGRATLVVTGGESGFAEDRLEIIQKVPGVKHAVPMVTARAYFAGADHASTTLTVLGVDLLKESAVRTYKMSDEQVIEDPLVFLNQPDSIIVTRRFASENGLKLEDSFELATARGSKRFVVRGLLSPEGPAKAYGGSIAMMDIDGARLTFGKEGKVDRIDIVLAEGEQNETVAKRLQSALGQGYTVERPEMQTESMERMVSSYQLMLTFFSTLALLVGLFLVANSVSISVAERKKEIGTLRALGAPRGGILALFLTEATLMGLMGSLGGALLGRILAHFLLRTVTETMTSQYLTKIEVGRLQFGGRDLFIAVALGTVASALAAAWPSYRATRIAPLEAMKRQELGEDASKRGFFGLSPWIGLGMLLFLSLSARSQWALGHAWLEHLNQAMAVVGAAFVAPALVAALIRGVRPLILPLGGALSRLAQDNLLRNPRRTGSNVMSLMVGLMLVNMIAIVNRSFEGTIMDWFERVFRADLLVSSNGSLLSYQAQALHEDIARELAQIPGVSAFRERVYGQRFIHLRFRGKNLGVKAIDEPNPELKFSNLDAIDQTREAAGRTLFYSKEPTVLVSENFVLHNHLGRGDILPLDTPSGEVAFKIGGVVVDFASPDGVIYMNRDHYKQYWHDPLVNAFGIQVLPGFTPDAVKRSIDTRLGRERNITVVANGDLKDQMRSMIHRSFNDARVIQIAALLVGLLGLLNTLLISVMERFRELGMLRAIGMTRRQLGLMILQEATFQGFFGSIAAIAVGTWIAYLWITYSLANSLGWIILFHFPWSSLALTAAAGLVVAWLAGAWPARRAAHLEIREALEYE